MVPPTEENTINGQKNEQTTVIEQTTIVHPADTINRVVNGTAVAQPAINGNVVAEETKP